MSCTALGPESSQNLHKISQAGESCLTYSCMAGHLNLTRNGFLSGFCYHGFTCSASYPSFIFCCEDTLELLAFVNLSNADFTSVLLVRYPSIWFPFA